MKETDYIFSLSIRSCRKLTMLNFRNMQNETERNTYFQLTDCFAEVTMVNGVCEQFSYQKEPYEILKYID